MLDDFIERLRIERGGTLLLIENSLTLLMTIKKIDKTLSSDVSVEEVFNIIINKIIEKLGDTGTLLIQTFDWDFCNKKKFDVLNSKSKTSFLGNIAITREDFIRTKHPMYSFAVTGRYKNELANLNNHGSFDIDSPFNFIYKKKAKMLIIDIPLRDSFTFAHHVEQMTNVKYRYNKDFTSTYIDHKGIKSIRTYGMFVRDIDNNVSMYLEPLENIFLEKGVMEQFNIDELVIRKVDLFKAYDVIENDIKYNNAKSLHKIG